MGGGAETGRVKYKEDFQVFVLISETNYTFYFFIYQGVTTQKKGITMKKHQNIFPLFSSLAIVIIK
jgi:hypothetical protein